MRTRFLMISAVLLLPVLGACSHADKIGFAPPSRDIGAAPAYLAPIDAPAPQAKQSPVVVAAERGSVIEQQNAIITCAHAEWGATRMALLNGERPVDAGEPGMCPLLDDAKAKAKPASATSKVKRKRWFRKPKEA